MPRGIPVATVAIGNAQNAGLLAIQILGTCQTTLQRQIVQYRQDLEVEVLQKQTCLDELGYRQYLEQRTPKIL